VLQTYKQKNKFSYYSSICCVYSCVCFVCFVQYITRQSLVWVKTYHFLKKTLEPSVINFIQMSMTGQGFFDSCREATYLQRRNKKRFVNISNLGSFFNFIGKIFISLQTSLICYILLLHTPSMQWTYSESVVPLIVSNFNKNTRRKKYYLFFFILSLIIQT
jgi:hypothetical protein